MEILLLVGIAAFALAGRKTATAVTPKGPVNTFLTGGQPIRSKADAVNAQRGAAGRLRPGQGYVPLSGNWQGGDDSSGKTHLLGFGDLVNQFIGTASGRAGYSNASVSSVGNSISKKLSPVVQAAVGKATSGVSEYIGNALSSSDATTSGSIDTSAPGPSTTVSTDDQGNATYLPDSV